MGSVHVGMNERRGLNFGRVILVILSLCEGCSYLLGYVAGAGLYYRAYSDIPPKVPFSTRGLCG